MCIYRMKKYKNINISMVLKGDGDGVTNGDVFNSGIDSFVGIFCSFLWLIIPKYFVSCARIKK